MDSDISAVFLGISKKVYGAYCNSKLVVKIEKHRMDKGRVKNGRKRLYEEQSENIFTHS